MIKQLIKYAKGYGVRAVFASLTIIVEVLLEVFIPFVMKDVINQGILGDAGMTIVIQKGLLMVGLALASLFFGVLSARLSVVASAGFAKNLRQAIFYKIQDFLLQTSTVSAVLRSSRDRLQTSPICKWHS